MPDSLTGLLDRAEFLSAAEELVRRCEVVSVAFIDIDDCKRVNTILTHVRGDQVVAEIGNR